MADKQDVRMDIGFIRESLKLCQIGCNISLTG